MCHRYFLFFYILREHGLIDLVVTTFRPHDLPPEVKQFSSAKQFPLVKVHRGVDANGVSMVDHTCDTVVDIEALLDRFECEDAANAKQSANEARAEKIFEDLYRVGFLQLSHNVRYTINDGNFLSAEIQSVLKRSNQFKTGYCHLGENRFVFKRKRHKVSAQRLSDSRRLLLATNPATLTSSWKGQSVQTRLKR